MLKAAAQTVDAINIFCIVTGAMADVHPLRAWRTLNAISQEALAGRLGVDDLTISRWETGATEPQKRHWPIIEEVTGLRRAEFLGFEQAAE